MDMNAEWVSHHPNINLQASCIAPLMAALLVSRQATPLAMIIFMLGCEPVREPLLRCAAQPFFLPAPILQGDELHDGH